MLGGPGGALLAGVTTSHYATIARLSKGPRAGTGGCRRPPFRRSGSHFGAVVTRPACPKLWLGVTPRPAVTLQTNADLTRGITYRWTDTDLRGRGRRLMV